MRDNPGGIGWGWLLAGAAVGLVLLQKSGGQHVTTPTTTGSGGGPLPSIPSPPAPGPVSSAPPAAGPFAGPFGLPMSSEDLISGLYDAAAPEPEAGITYYGGAQNQSTVTAFVGAMEGGADPTSVYGPSAIYSSKSGGEPVFQWRGYSVNDPSVLGPWMFFSALPNAAAAAADPAVALANLSIGLAGMFDATWGADGVMRGTWTPVGILGPGWSPSVVTAADGTYYLYFHTGSRDFTHTIDYRRKLDHQTGQFAGDPEPLVFAADEIHALTFAEPGGPTLPLLANLDVQLLSSGKYLMLANTMDLSTIVASLSDDGLHWSAPMPLIVAPPGSRLVAPAIVIGSDGALSMEYGVDSGHGSTVIRRSPFSVR